MIGEPRIEVDCEKCGETESFEMTSLAMKGNFDDRNLAKDMEKAGWVVDGDETYCSDECYREAKGLPEPEDED